MHKCEHIWYLAYDVANLFFDYTSRRLFKAMTVVHKLTGLFAGTYDTALFYPIL